MKSSSTESGPVAADDTIQAAANPSSTRGSADECCCPTCRAGADARDDHRHRCRTAQLQPLTECVRIDVDAAYENLDGARVVRRQGVAQPLFAEAELLEHLEATDAFRQPVSGQIGDVGVELPQPVPRRVVANQSGTDDRAV